jgi:hypothetical protein
MYLQAPGSSKLHSVDSPTSCALVKLDGDLSCKACRRVSGAIAELASVPAFLLPYTRLVSLEGVARLFLSARVRCNGRAGNNVHCPDTLLNPQPHADTLK